ncbi:hypothetical protein CSCA_0336 [Clostridium scatologenes]|uniref:Uncharacterized protein n=1 Tax=Clostridium scatologenes TaxID=1548 RepID=A0A0E3GPV1_CLOSL|nr:hypothetical protein CSCA_0336 [Clostridium scatologenes]
MRIVNGVDIEKFKSLSFDVIIISIIYFTVNLIKKCLT